MIEEVLTNVIHFIAKYRYRHVYEHAYKHYITIVAYSRIFFPWLLLLMSAILPEKEHISHPFDIKIIKKGFFVQCIKKISKT